MLGKYVNHYTAALDSLNWTSILDNLDNLFMTWTVIKHLRGT